MMTWDRSSHPRSRLPQTQREVRKDASTHSDTDMKPPPVKERQPSQLEYHADKERQPSTRGSRPSFACMPLFPSACPPACLFGPRVPAILKSHSLHTGGCRRVSFSDRTKRAGEAGRCFTRETLYVGTLWLRESKYLACLGGRSLDSTKVRRVAVDRYW